MAANKSVDVGRAGSQGRGCDRFRHNQGGEVSGNPEARPLAKADSTRNLNVQWFFKMLLRKIQNRLLDWTFWTAPVKSPKVIVPGNFSTLRVTMLARPLRTKPRRHGTNTHAYRMESQVQ